MAERVSVIVPVFNGRPFLPEALESLRAQTHAEWEAIVVDDGSTDGSGDIARTLAVEDDRIRVHRQENRGLPAARNAGIERAEGTFVAFLDADDLWLPEKLQRQLGAWREGVLYSDAWLLEGAGPPKERIGGHVAFARGQIFSALLVENFVPVLTALLPRELVDRAGRFDETLRAGCEDYDLWLRLADAGVPFDYVDEPLAVYRLHEHAMSRNAVAMAGARLTVFQRVAAHSNGERRQLVERRAAAELRNLAAALRQRAWRETLAGELNLARRDLRAAHETAPTLVSGIGTAVASRSDRALRTLAHWRTSRAAP